MVAVVNFTFANCQVVIYIKKLVAYGMYVEAVCEIHYGFDGWGANQAEPPHGMCKNGSPTSVKYLVCPCVNSTRFCPSACTLKGNVS